MNEDDYGTGYADGKAKGLFECAIAVGHMSVTPECRCSPCTALRYAIHSMGEATPGPSAAEPKRGSASGVIARRWWSTKSVRGVGHDAEVSHRRPGL